MSSTVIIIISNSILPLYIDTAIDIKIFFFLIRKNPFFPFKFNTQFLNSSQQFKLAMN